MAMEVTAESLANVFNQVFEESERTRMVTGAPEPYYVPSGMHTSFSDGTEIASDSFHRVFSRADYAASVLHEAAHWLIAGAERRQQLDYGYWYEPDGRTAEQQGQFEKVEFKPQALERILCRAAGLPFRVSTDNVNSAASQASESFLFSVHRQTLTYLAEGLSGRAHSFSSALAQKFRTQGEHLDQSSYVFQQLT